MRTNLIQKNEVINSNRMLIAHNALKAIAAAIPKYFVERATINRSIVQVDFIDEEKLSSGIVNDDNWLVCQIDLTRLESFAAGEYADASLYIDLTASQYVESHLIDVCRAYLNAGKEFTSC